MQQQERGEHGAITEGEMERWNVLKSWGNEAEERKCDELATRPLQEAPLSLRVPLRRGRAARRDESIRRGIHAHYEALTASRIGPSS